MCEWWKFIFTHFNQQDFAIIMLLRIVLYICIIDNAIVVFFFFFNLGEFIFYT